jgi:hypothetical protein
MIADAGPEMSTIIDRLTESPGPMSRHPHSGANYHEADQIITHLNYALGPFGWDWTTGEHGYDELAGEVYCFASGAHRMSDRLDGQRFDVRAMYGANTRKGLVGHRRTVEPRSSRWRRAGGDVAQRRPPLRGRDPARARRAFRPSGRQSSSRASGTSPSASLGEARRQIAEDQGSDDLID